jgi:hypothetical protein
MMIQDMGRNATGSLFACVDWLGKHLIRYCSGVTRLILAITGYGSVTGKGTRAPRSRKQSEHCLVIFRDL